jgi:hypothetical protein
MLVDTFISRTFSNSHTIADVFRSLFLKKERLFWRGGECFQNISTQALPHGTVHVPIRTLPMCDEGVLSVTNTPSAHRARIPSPLPLRVKIIWTRNLPPSSPLG